ncbi:uncharacterized protein ACNS7B_017258 [Menidia menidia]
MAAMYRSASLGNKELAAVYEAGGDEDSVGEECDVDSESSEEGKGGRGVRSSLSLEIYGLHREQQVFFSNQEYYRRLEELKSTHLRNVAELERLYISQGTDRPRREGEGGPRGPGQAFSGSARRLQRINSQEELDFHELSSGSDYSEAFGEDGLGELDWAPRQERIFQRDDRRSPDQKTSRAAFRSKVNKASCPKTPARASRVRGAMVTVPQPFRMTLREEERRRRRVRTRSEVELENSLLRRELEELRECRKQFRATPAPPHTRLPLYGRGGGGGGRGGSPQPFSFLERERRKKEAKMAAELGARGQREERQAFRARAAPGGPGAVARQRAARHQHPPQQHPARPPPPPGGHGGPERAELRPGAVGLLLKLLLKLPPGGEEADRAVHRDGQGEEVDLRRPAGGGPASQRVRGWRE